MRHERNRRARPDHVNRRQSRRDGHRIQGVQVRRDPGRADSVGPGHLDIPERHRHRRPRRAAAPDERGRPRRQPAIVDAVDDDERFGRVNEAPETFGGRQVAQRWADERHAMTDAALGDERQSRRRVRHIRKVGFEIDDLRRDDSHVTRGCPAGIRSDDDVIGRGRKIAECRDAAGRHARSPHAVGLRRRVNRDPDGVGTRARRRRF